MAVTGLKEHRSEFYPPRSRWYTRLIYDSWRPLRRRAQIENITRSWSWPLPPLKVLASILVPGAAFMFYKREIMGCIVLAAYLLALAVSVVWLGSRVGNMAFGAMVSCHITSICFLEAYWLKESDLRTRLLATICTIIAIWGLAYLPLMHYVQNHWFMPMTRNGTLMIVKSGVKPRTLKRGDFVAFKTSRETYGGGHGDLVHLAAGMYVDPVIGLPGDSIVFSNHVVFVNGRPQPAEALMPYTGGFTVPEKEWFIWPTVDINQHGAAAFDIPAVLRQVAMVSETQLVGRPFNTWCGRRQLP